MKNWMSAPATAALMALAGGASADPWYVGGQVGTTDFSVDCPRGFSCDTSDTGVKLYGGYTIAPHLSLEVAYIDFGGFSSNYFRSSVESTALTFNGAYRLDFSPKWTGVGRFGLARVSSDYSDVFGSESDSVWKPYFGIGIEYAINKQLKVVGSWDFTQFEVGGDDGSVNMLGVGLQYGF